MRRLLVILGLALAAWPALGASKLNLTLPASGPFKVWFDTAYPGAPTADAQDVTGTSVSLIPPAKGYLAVLDAKTGDLAIKPVAGLKGKLTLATADFDNVEEVKIDVQYNGKPLVAASVDAKDGSRTQSTIIDASKNGEATFYGCKAGTLAVTVHYVSNGKDATPVELSFELKADRDDPVPTFKAAVPDEALTVDSGGLTPSSTTGALPAPPPASKKELPSTGQMFARLLQLLIGFIVAGFLIYFIFWLWKSHSGALQEKLEGLGVQIPKDPNGPMADAPVIPATPIQPKPIEKIMLADSDPTPLGTPLPAAISMAPSVPGQAPHLMSDSGATLGFDEGVTEVGRDQAGALGVPDPSTLSRRHAEFVRSAESLSVRDLGSTNGTFVNGRKIDGETSLKPGDSVQLGAIRFRVEA